MHYRVFGGTGLEVSEAGFGAWAIGGTSFGSVARSDALAALGTAEDLGCNFVDTAAVYGSSEEILGAFLKGHRERWIVSTKYSGQQGGMTATLEEQLRRLGTDRIDFYQIHWAPHADGSALYEELERLRESGKVRFTGVSLYTAADIAWVLRHTTVDGFQVAFSLLDPQPMVEALGAVRLSGRAVIVRSALKEGFLTGSYTATAVFGDANDQRQEWSRERIARTAASADRFRFLEVEAGSLLRAAISYPLSFPEVSTVILSTKNAAQARANFGGMHGGLSARALDEIHEVQKDMGLFTDPWTRRIRRAAARLVAAVRRP